MTSEDTCSLRGKVVAITRPEGQANETAELVERLGGTPYVVPMIEISFQRNRQKILDFIHGITRGDFDLLIFLSLNGVRSLFSTAQEVGLASNLSEEMTRVQVIAIGTRTLQELRSQGVEKAVVSNRQGSEGLLEILDEFRLDGLRVGIPRSSRADEALKEELEARGAFVREVIAYESTIPSDKSRVTRFLVDLSRGDIDAVTFTSASIARNLFTIAQEDGSAQTLRESLGNTRVAAIGPMTRKALESLGVEVDAIPERHSIEAMLVALAENFNLDRGE